MKNIIPLTPHLSSATIAENDVTSARLSALLETAFIDHVIEDDGDIYVTDMVGLPLWVQIVTDRKLVYLYTGYRIDDEPGSDWLSRVNDMNRNIMVPQFAYYPKVVAGNYWMTYDGGLSVGQFVKMLRLFSSTFQAGLMLNHGESRNALQEAAVRLNVLTFASRSDVTPDSKTKGPADAE